MMAGWRALCERFAARPRRERLLVAALIVLGLPLAVLGVWGEPAWRAHRTLGAEAAHLRAEAGRSSSSRPTDPNQLAREELAVLEARWRSEQQAIADRARALVRPDEMVALLEQWLPSHPGVRLIAMASLPATPLEAAPRADADAGAAKDRPVASAAPGLYRHGVTLEIEGSWPALRAYLGEIERSPRRLHWSALHLQSDEHPRVRMRLTVNTLALEAAWLTL